MNITLPDRVGAALHLNHAAIHMQTAVEIVRGIEEQSSRSRLVEFAGPGNRAVDN